MGSAALFLGERLVAAQALGVALVFAGLACERAWVRG
jgi:drug/metabolite transporter (DMT)-like permease